ncbi:DeoR/GlpR family DNA-binding transcription regulator [Oceanobacillus sp. CFH 90083]|uniref:DeoR/GlpR family DNA-binding transcription regulator n=1 Tax=Oceanobacillus sp. CFH 90083 TaxID=2592336 RepID=UPI001D13F84B|nr:DeoR/GlpR family DNA-binding transcription regulator [Oceanobacillus sp. CFH 90083]
MINIKSKRIAALQEYITLKQRASYDELVNKFAVSKNTIRNDVQELCKSGDIIKVHGGAAVNQPAEDQQLNKDITKPLTSFTYRQTKNQPSKQRIAEQAAGYIQNGDIIFIDTGTTVLELIEYIREKQITIVTNNIDFILKTLPYNNLTVYSLGGVLDRRTQSFTTIQAQKILKNYNINKAFLAATAISIKNGVTSSIPVESELKSYIAGQIEQKFLLVDHQKFDKVALTTYCDLNQLDYLITDQSPDQTYIDYCKKYNVELVIAKQNEGV